jgi:Flp pilus assembly protein TadD
LALAQIYLQFGQNDRALPVLEQVLNDPQLDGNSALGLAQAYSSVGNFAKLETVLDKYTKLAPGQPEAWYDLAALKAHLGKNAEALPALRQAIQLSTARLKSSPTQRDLRAEALKDPRFNSLRQNPEFKAIAAAP